jgi:hypothetical protein
MTERGAGAESPRNSLEVAARRLWRDWGGQWARWTICAGCGERAYCGARRQRGPYLCLPCWDQA